MMTSNARMQRNWVTHILPVGMQNGIGTLEISLAVSKPKHAITVGPSNLTLGIYPREMKTYVHIKPIHEYTL